MTLALYQLDDGAVFALDFGAPPYVELGLEAQIDAILTDVEAHRSTFWLLPPLQAEAVLAGRLARTSATKEQPTPAEQVVPLLQALGRVGASGSVDLVERYVQHPHIDVQLATIEALGRLGTERQEKILAPLLHSGVAELEQASMLALSHFPSDRTLPLVEAAAIRRPSLAKLAAIYEQQLRVFRAQDPDAYVRAYLGYDHREDLVPMVPTLFEPLLKAAAEPALVQWVAYLWAAACDRQAARIMATWLAEPRAPIELRRISAQAMGRMRVRGAVSILLDQLQSSDPELQRNSVLALGRIGRAKALLPLLSIWQAQGGALHREIRVAAFRLATPGGFEQLLAAFQAGAPLPRLFLLHDEDALEGYQASWILRELSSPESAARRDALLVYAVFCADDQVLATLAQFGRDPDASVRDLALRLYQIRYDLELRRGTLPTP